MTLPLNTSADVLRLATEIHADNVAAGWWSDPTTGERINRNVGEMLMLSVSEICEAVEGLTGRLMDDKLPHREMIEVELADFLIRQLDLIGGLGIAEATAEAFERAGGQNLVSVYSGFGSPEQYLLKIICFQSAAMEHHRKGRLQQMAEPLVMAMHGALILDHVLDLDVIDAIAEKREFNRHREDHKVENRRAAGGKAY